MDDMGTPGQNHPAHRGLGKRTEGQFNNVLDLNASRVIKNKTGQAVPIKLDRKPLSASEESHIDSVIREGN
jgi:hypothetical protein